LHKAQLNWSTFEKEAYAIFYTITKFDFLLRDVQFVIETDHKNLTFLKTAQSAKVRRWQLALQEFDFKYIHIKGDDNVVADAFSRLFDHHPMDKVAKTEMLTAFFISGDSVGSAMHPLPNRGLIAIMGYLSQQNHLLTQPLNLK
jgi:hypothetical protein